MQRKDLELTPEEALQLTRRECAPFWYNSEPLLVGLIDEETKKASAYPIDLEFPKFAWLIFFIDITTPTFEPSLNIATEWINRFTSLQLKSLFVVRESYSFFKERLIMRPLLEKINLNFPSVIDSDNALQKAFEVSKLPCTILFNKEKTLFVNYMIDGYQQTEGEIHRFLRESDPGLPLKPYFNEEATVKEIEFNLELGKGKNKNIIIEKMLTEIKDSEVHFVGNWEQDKECIYTSDEAAQIVFKSQTKNISFFSRSLNKNEEITRVYFQLDEGPVYDLFSGSDMRFDEESKSFLNIREAQLYSALRDLPEDKRHISCTIPWAKKSTFALYKICGFN